jgi:signal peptidase I
MENLQKRVPIIALLLSLLTPGLGQMYNGQLKKATVFYLGGLLLTILLSLSGLFSNFYGMILCLAILVGYMILVMLDALLNAMKLQTITTRKYNRWYVYVLIILTQAFLINPYAKSIIIPIKAYRIPASSMAPALLVGDHLVVNKKYYHNEKPIRGDIIVFPLPTNTSKDYIKRVIGLSGEKLEIRNDNVFINNQRIEEPYVEITDASSPFTKKSPKADFGPIVVRPDNLFVLGDNRDHSYDSRYWGSVEISALKGKALYIYWARDKDRIGMEIK